MIISYHFVRTLQYAVYCNNHMKVALKPVVMRKKRRGRSFIIQPIFYIEMWNASVIHDRCCSWTAFNARGLHWSHVFFTLFFPPFDKMQHNLCSNMFWIFRTCILCIMLHRLKRMWYFRSNFIYRWKERWFDLKAPISKVSNANVFENTVNAWFQMLYKWYSTT